MLAWNFAFSNSPELKLPVNWRRAGLSLQHGTVVLSSPRAALLQLGDNRFEGAIK